MSELVSEEDRSPQRDRFDIQQAVLRYCRGVDRLDLELVRSAYHPDGIDHHTGFDGTVDEYLTWVAAALQKLSGTMHIIANQLIELGDDAAVCETYGQAVHWGEPADSARRNFTSGFRYVDHFTRVDGRWAIAERWAVREWTRSDAGRFVAKEGDGPAGRRDSGDPLYRLRSRVLG